MTAATTSLEVVIGLEVHAELLTQSKMFCACSAAYLAGEPNSHTCPVCLGLPGALPVMNRRAIELTIRTALALNCEIAEFSKFDRKNYFYPDLPKGYQISQYDLPMSRSGHLDIEVDGEQTRVGITRVHLEEDTGKLIHSGDIHTSSESLVDLNRAGVPLMEIVSEPDMRSADEAREYMQRLRQILVWIGVSDGNMEEGSLRCDANVSVRPAGATELGTKVEVKNMNSFRAVYLALQHEIERQSLAFAAGETIVQETRGWNEAKGVTVAQRCKEYAHDYRYFPSPTCPRCTSRPRWWSASGPPCPSCRRHVPAAWSETWASRLSRLACSPETVDLADYFEAVIAAGAPAAEAANWVLGEVSRVLNSGVLVAELKVRPGALGGLIARKLDGTISNNQAKDLFAALSGGGGLTDDVAAVDAAIADRGLRQVSDTGQLQRWVDEAIAAQPQAWDDFRAGNERASGRLVGEVMKRSGGQASGPAAIEILRSKLPG